MFWWLIFYLQEAKRKADARKAELKRQQDEAEQQLKETIALKELKIAQGPLYSYYVDYEILWMIIYMNHPWIHCFSYSQHVPTVHFDSMI